MAGRALHIHALQRRMPHRSTFVGVALSNPASMQLVHLCSGSRLTKGSECLLACPTAAALRGRQTLSPPLPAMLPGAAHDRG